MILVLLGTQQNDFSRLLKAVDKAIEEGNIKEEVIVLVGTVLTTALLATTPVEAI